MATKEDDLWELDDDALEAAFKEAVASQSADPEDSTTDDETEEHVDTTTDEDSDTVDDETVDDDSDEEDEDGVEQPDENVEASDHDSSTDPDEEVDSENKTEDGDDVNPDGDNEVPGEESLDDKTELEGEGQPAKDYSFRANGKDYNFTSEEIVQQFPKIFGKAMDYTKKMQTIAPWRKTIDAIEGAELSHDDVSLMIDVLKGDKTAINEVLKRTNTDTLDLGAEEDASYVAKDYGRDAGALAVQDVVGEINQDVEYTKTHSILSKEWDESSWDTMSKNPEMIRLLHADVKSGTYDTIQPIAEKLKVFDGANKPDLEYYKLAAQQHFSKQAVQDKAKQDAELASALAKQQQADATKAQEALDAEASRVAAATAAASKRKAAKSASAKRKAAAPSKGAATDRGVVDYLDESDENFDDWYKKLQDSM